MDEKQKKKNGGWQRYIAMAFFMLMGVSCGILMVAYMRTYETGNSLLERILTILVLLLVMYAAMFAQIIIHEAGHLIFGLLSGYKFISFRIMSFMWVKENGKIKFRRLSLAGTGGQCLMAPPDLVDGKLPVILYNLGGVLLNIAAGILFLGAYFAVTNIPLLSFAMLLSSAIGFISAFMNGVPMHMGTIDNDGYNAFALTRNDKARYAFWVQMKVNEQITKGVRLKDMPDEWFATSSDEEMKNSMVAAIGVFAANRLMDEQNFEDADRLMAHLLEIESGMVGLHRNLIICDRIYLELIGENRREVLDGMRTQEQLNFMKAMKNYMTVLRTEYAYALLCEKDSAKANEIKARFEKRAKTHPYPIDVVTERELMEIADKKADAAVGNI